MPKKTFNDLTDDQKNNYQNMLKRLGLDPASSKVGVIRDQHLKQAAKAGDNTVILSSLAEESHVEPHYVTINSLDELKDLIGFPDEDFDSGKRTEVISGSHAAFHDGLLQAADRHDLSQEDRNALGKAAENYIFGHSARVDPRMKEAYENVYMPMQVAVFTAEDGNLTLEDGQVYKIQGPDPVTLVFGTITMGQGSQIVATVESHINTQVLQDSQ